MSNTNSSNNTSFGLIDLFNKYKEIIMYLIMGVATTVVSWISFAILTKIILIDSEVIRVTIANVLSWIISVLFAYVTNKIWVFNSRSWEFKFVIKELIKFVSARLLTGFLEWFGVPFLVTIGLDYKPLGIDGGLSKIVISVLVIILNYVFSKLIIFKNK